MHEPVTATDPPASAPVEERQQAQILAYARDLRAALQRGREVTAELARTHRETVAALAAAVDLRDEVTGGHVFRVANYGAVLATDLAPELRDDPQLVYGFLLHDIGKLAIPDAVLNKDGPLDPDELRIMRSHVEHGIRFVKGVSFLRPALTIIATHHEHVDGGGYPQGLRGDEIPLAARMFVACDAFDAMIHDRPYRAGMAPERALAELRRGVGTQFDPDVVAALERNLERIVAIDDRPSMPALADDSASIERRGDRQQVGRQVFESVDQAMVLLSPGGAVHDANARFCALFGLPQVPTGMLLHELVERSVAGIGASAGAGAQWRRLERDLFRGRREGAFVAGDGRVLRWFSNVVRGDGDAVTGRVVVIDDHVPPAAGTLVEDVRGELEDTLPDLATLADHLADQAGAEAGEPDLAARARRVRAGLERLEHLVRRLDTDVAGAVEAGELGEPEQ